jgi:hypothetical protein
MVRYFIIFGAVLFSLYILVSCASQAPLTGGIKDTSPPHLLSSIPATNTRNFSGKEITLNFDEFIVLKSVQQKLVVSPPMKNPPEVVTRSKSVVIRFSDELIPNTTYTLNFSDAIADLTEGNSIPEFQFCFSTGTTIDSLMISGKVWDAYTLKPDPKLYIMLYKDNVDSLPLKNIPYYLTKSNDMGDFSFLNIASGHYKIFALNDANNNLLYDLPSEKIAFSDSVIVPGVQRIQLKDTLTNKLVTAKTDSISGDSVYKENQFKYYPDNLRLFSFFEDRTKQFIKSATRSYWSKCTAIMNHSPYGNISVKGVNVSHYIMETGLKGDTITIWLTDSLEFKKDTVKFCFNYTRKDSTDSYFETTDTISFVFKEIKNQAPLKFLVSGNITNNQAWNSTSPIRLTFSTPVKIVGNESIQLEESKDTIYHVVIPEIESSKISPCTYFLKYPWKDQMNYRLKIPKNNIIDIYGNKNDSIIRKFKTFAPDYYTTGIFKIQGPEKYYVFELLDGAGKKVMEWGGTVPLTKKIERMSPGKYRIRCWQDSNSNYEWDTGNYLKHLQPEKVYNYPDEINLRSNWEMEILWELKE